MAERGVDVGDFKGEKRAALQLCERRQTGIFGQKRFQFDPG